MCAALFWGTLEQVLQCCSFSSIHCQIPGWAPRVPGGRGVGCITRGEGGGGDKRFLGPPVATRTEKYRDRREGKDGFPGLWPSMSVTDGSSSLEFSGVPQSPERAGPQCCQ